MQVDRVSYEQADNGPSVAEICILSVAGPLDIETPAIAHQTRIADREYHARASIGFLTAFHHAFRDLLRIGVIHDSLNYVGGAERVCLKTIEALRDAGHFVILGTIEKTNWELVGRVFGPSPLPDSEVSLLPFNFTALRLYTSLLSPLVFSSIEDKCDLTICTDEDLMLLPTKFGYMHYLPLSLVRGLAGRPQSSISWLYSMPYKKLQIPMLKNLSGRTLMSNSRFTQQALERRTGFKSTVVHPPVNLANLTPDASKLRDRVVLAFGRFSPEKNFEFALSLAEILPTVRFLIIGKFSGALSASYYRMLVRAREVKKLKNASILHDCSRSQIVTAFATSSIFLNATVNETFGLAVVEAMAAGLVPLVHQSGGPWIDILGERQGIYGFSYGDKIEAARIISEIINDKSRLSEIASRSLNRARLFSDNNFKTKLTEFLRV